MKEGLQKENGGLFFKNGVAILLFIISVCVFAMLAYQVSLGNEIWFDDKAFNFFENRSPRFNRIMWGVSFLGSSSFLFPAYVFVIVVLLARKKRPDALKLGLVGISSFALLHILKHAFQRSRPQLPLFEELTNHGFPSGHAVSSVVFCSSLILLIWKTRLSDFWKWLLSIFLFLASMLIGISRISLRYHYASDVLAGFCLGFAWVTIFFFVAEKISEKRKKV